MLNFLKMKKFSLSVGLLIPFVITGLDVLAQCETWVNSPKKGEAEDAHVLYRGFIKEKRFDEALTDWEKAYSIAPAADGNRSTHYSDGVEIFMHKFNTTADQTEKKAYAEKIIKLYDQWVQCYPAEAAYARGRQAYNMFYYLQSDYAVLEKVLKEAVEKGGNNSEYIVLDPYAHVTVHMFRNNKTSQSEARSVYEKLVNLADHNITNNKSYGQYYQQAKEAMLATFSAIEREIFDCAYFKNKYLPEYKANPNDREVYRNVYRQLVMGGCDKSDPIVYEIFLKDSIATMEEYKATNPGFFANELFKAGNYEGAIAKYKEAIKDEADPDKQSYYLLAIAKIEYGKLDRYSSARTNALQAAKIRPNWGEPFILIGDMYASTSSSCGSDSFEKQLAVLAALDKYAYAKAIDDNPELQAEVNNKIARYSSFKPDLSEAHMRGIKEGQAMSVPCWIGETVKVRFK